MKERSKYHWVKDWDKSTKFFHGMALGRLRGIRISSFPDEGSRLESRDDIMRHILGYFIALYAKEDWNKPSLDNLASWNKPSLDYVSFASISVDSATCLKIEFLVEKVKGPFFNFGGNKPPGTNGFPLIFFQHFWDVLYEDTMDFI